MSTSYIPGVCNIGPAEIKRRKLTGTIGLYVTVILFAVFLVGGFTPAWRLLLFIPASIGAIGYLQAKLHFCVGFGRKGLFNVGETLETQETVENAEYRRQDQRKALMIAGIAAGIGLVIAVGVFLLP